MVKIKRKGAYEYNIGWHQNHSALVVPKVVEQVLVYGADPMTLLMNWPDKMDFMLRVKVPRSSRLIGVKDGQEIELQNTTRYYAAKGGVQLVKIMPPLAKKPGVWRRIGVESGWTVCVCNDLRDATLPVNMDYYRREIDKLILELK